MSELSYAHGTGTTALLGDTIGHNLDRAVEAFGEREALVDVASGRRWTYAEFGPAVDELARALMASGWPRGPGRDLGDQLPRVVRPVRPVAPEATAK